MKKFNPKNFSVHEWVKLAVDSGAKYMVSMVKHAEGFCLWDSELTRYKITNTPFKRDLLRELSKAVDRKEMRLGIYYNTETYLNNGHDIWNDLGMSYSEFIQNQLKEVLTKSGKKINWKA